jgi:hypothetical protein
MQSLKAGRSPELKFLLSYRHLSICIFLGIHMKKGVSSTFDSCEGRALEAPGDFSGKSVKAGTEMNLCVSTE